MSNFLKAKKVVVIGAGLAGLTAAYRLQMAGVDVDLYEARNRVGGRVFTVNINGNVAELGAQNINDGGESTYVKRLVDEFDLELISNRVNLNHSYFDGMDLTPIGQLLKNKNFNPQILRNQLNELASISQNIREVLEKIVNENDPLFRVIAVRLAAYEGAPLEKLSPIYVETLFHMLLGGLCSAHQGSGEEENFADVVCLKHGNAQLSEKIAEALGNRLHLDRALTKVSRNEDGAFRLVFQEGQEVKADLLVLAIPCSVYEKIIFEERVIPLERLKAIQNVQYGRNAKILVPFSKVSSRKTGLVNDQIVSFLDSARKTFTIYCTGEASLFSSETIKKAYIQARPMMEKGFGESCPSFENPVYAKAQNFVSYNTPVGYSWPNDPYVRGSYSYVSPGQENLLTALMDEKGERFKALFAPIEDLYFAGEHASILLDVPGTMEAACESGERIARKILEELRNSF